MNQFNCWISLFLIGATAVAASPNSTYLSQVELDQINIMQALPLPPAVGDPTDDVDVAYFWSERSLILTHRGLDAAQDDVYEAKDVWPRFATVLQRDKPLDDVQLQTLFGLINKAVKDVATLVAPIKMDLPAGRTRPFVRFAGTPTCLEPYDLVSGHKDNDYKFHLRETGSYPSTHATIGILWASVLAALYPQRSSALLERGISFGESRAICGFHFESDVSAGRMVGQLLFRQLEANKQFARELKSLKSDLTSPLAR